MGVRGGRTHSASCPGCRRKDFHARTDIFVNQVRFRNSSVYRNATLLRDGSVNGDGRAPSASLR